MTSTFRALQFFTLGTWVGSILYFSVIVAPGAFHTIANQDEAGALIAYTLGHLHIAGIALGLVYLLTTLLLGKSAGALGKPASLLVFLMIALTAVSQFRVIAKMEMLRLEAGSIFATPPDSPIRVAFDRLHTFSVWIEGIVVIAGVAAIYLTARAAKPVPVAAAPAVE
jgi:uncharacterized protein DUF4149